jgi:hypothetical protein
MMSYSVRNHTAFVAANYDVNEKVQLFANIVFNDGRGSMGNLALDPSGLPGQPPGFDYYKISELGRFSALSIGRTQQIYGANWKFHPNWMLSISGYYGNYDDRAPYLFDRNGKSAGVHGGITYLF